MQAWQAGFQGETPTSSSATTRPAPARAASSSSPAARSTSPARTPRWTTRSWPPREERCGGGEVFELPELRLADRRHLQPRGRRRAQPVARRPSPASSPARSPPGTTRPSPRTTPTRRCRHRDHRRCTAPTTPAPPRTSPTTWPGRRRRVDRRGRTASGRCRRRGRQRHLRRRRARSTARRGAIGYADASQAGDLGVAEHQGRRGVRRVRRPRPPRPSSTNSARGRGPRRVRLRHRRSTATPSGRRVPDRAGQLPHRLHRVRRPGDGRPASRRFMGYVDQRGGPAGRRRERRQRADLDDSSARAGPDRGRRHHRRRPDAGRPRRRPGTSHRTSRAAAPPDTPARRTHDTTPPRSSGDRHRSAPTEPPSAPRPCAGRATGSSPAAPGRRHLHPARPGRRRGLPHHRGVPAITAPGRGPARAARASPPTSPRWSSARCSPRCIALLVATPLAVGDRAVHLALRAPAARPGLGYVVDLLAAIPSVVYGFWGIAVARPGAVPFYAGSTDNLGFIPFFAGPASATGRTMFTAGLVLAVMILPIITAHLPRGLPADAGAARGGGAGARRHPLGDDPDGGAALRQVRRHRRRDARPRPRARRDDGRGDGAVRPAPSSRST